MKPSFLHLMGTRLYTTICMTEFHVLCIPLFCLSLHESSAFIDKKRKHKRFLLLLIRFKCLCTSLDLNEITKLEIKRWNST